MARMRKILLLQLFFVFAFTGCSLAQANCEYAETGFFYPIVIQNVSLCGGDPEIGDVICVFDEGLPVGSYEFVDLDNKISVSAWKKDDTYQLPGYTTGHIIDYQYYDASVDVTYEMNATYNLGNGTFENGQYAIVGVLTCVDPCDNDNTPPVITCPADVTIQCDESTDPANTGLATATDNCDDVVDIQYTDSYDGGNCSVITRTWTATDENFNTATCVQTITVQDNVAPVIICPDDITVECDGSTDPAITGQATATDNCDASVAITYSDVTNGDVITRTFTAIDDCGNSSSCEQIITFEDTTPPTISCPSDLFIQCDESTDPSNTGFATATDNCDLSVDITYTEFEIGGTCPNEKNITRTWEAADDAGNKSYCVQTISVVDDIAPVITCPIDVTVLCNESTDPANTGSATAIDNCDQSVDITYSDLPNNNTITRTWKATDDCGNISDCVQLITLDDNTLPIIDCPADITIQCEESTDPANTGSATATDNCDQDVEVTYSDSEISDNCSVISRTWAATDNFGNTANCVQTITLVDNTAPVISCPGNINIECDGSVDPAATGMATATDNCDISVIPTFYDVTNGDIITRTWTATDNCGNSSTCDQLITLEDTTPPNIYCPEDTTIKCQTSTDPAVTWSASAVDNCDEDVEITYTDVRVDNVLTRTWTAVDDDDNKSECDQVITISPPWAPVLIFPADYADDVSLPITFYWQLVTNAEKYKLEISANADFNNILYSVETQETSHKVDVLEELLDYHWRVSAYNEDCGWGDYRTRRFGAGTDIHMKSSEELPTDFSLYQNHPNPFNPFTTIEFSVPRSEFVTLEIYNVLGEKIETLVSEQLSAGYWSLTWDGNDNASGIYFYKIQAGDYVKTRKMLLLK